MRYYVSEYMFDSEILPKELYGELPECLFVWFGIEEPKDKKDLATAVHRLCDGSGEPYISEILRGAKALLGADPFPTEQLGVNVGIMFRDSAEAKKWFQDFIDLIERCTETSEH